MKCVAGILFTLVVLFHQESAANKACCHKFQYGGKFYQEKLFKGGFNHVKTPVKGFNHADGYNYLRYFAISATHTPHFVLSDVCFHTKCADSVKVVLYDSHWKILANIVVPLTFHDVNQYYNDHYVCLSDPQYQVYYKFNKCLEHVRYVRIFASQFDDFNFNYGGINGFGAGVGIGVGAKGGKFGAGKFGGGKLVGGNIGRGIGQGGKFFAGGNFNYDPHYVNPSCIKGALIWDGHMTGCSAIPTKQFGGQFGVGSGKFGVGSGKFGGGSGKFGAGSGKFGVGSGKFGLGSGKFGKGSGKFGLGVGSRKFRGFAGNFGLKKL